MGGEWGNKGDGGLIMEPLGFGVFKKAFKNSVR